MKIHAYLDAEISGRTPMLALATLWARSWAAAGWEPKIIRKHDVGTPLELENVRRIIRNLPTVNDPAYEEACWLRWAAMAKLGGGWMCDLDVINYGFRPDNVPALGCKLNVSPQLACFDQHVPCLVSGTEKGYSDFFNIAADISASLARGAVTDPSLTIIEGRRHISDMHLLSKLRAGTDYVALDLVREFGEEGWETHPLVHFSSGRCRGVNKIDAIRQNRPFPAPVRSR